MLYVIEHSFVFRKLKLTHLYPHLISAPYIPDSSINIDDFNLIRKDRSGQRGGGVCAFVRSNIPFVPLPELCCPDHEILWVKLRPYRLPREFSCIVVGLVYHPPQADDNELYDHLITSLDTILASHPTAGVIVMGDFNQFDFRRLCRNTSLKQIVKKSTRGNATLDLIFTNTRSYYRKESAAVPPMQLCLDYTNLLTSFPHCTNEFILFTIFEITICYKLITI